MGKKYYLHRISHEGYVAYSLLSEGYLSLGWEMFSETNILEAAREEGYPTFGPIVESFGQGHNRARWSMWYFARMNVGDTVIVPLYNGKFSAYEISEQAKGIGDLEDKLSNFKSAWDNHVIGWKDHRLYDQTEGRQIDLGFYIKVEPIVEDVPRNYVTGVLISRMKIRATNADITDIKEYVEKGIEAGKNKKPITLYEDAIDGLVNNLDKAINDTLDPDKFERLIKWYLKKCGASSAWIPAKNESGKKDGADADIIAEFENLKYIVYVQAKHHRGETSEWSVHQIDSYKNQKSEGDPDYTYATWVITSAESFSQKAIEEADKNGVRLINGKEFSRMLLNIGLLDVDEAFEWD